MGWKDLFGSLVGGGEADKAADDGAPDEASALDKLKTAAATELAKRQAQVAADAASRVVSAAAGSALDDLEKALLGKVGAADEILKKDDGDVDPLERLRAQMGDKAGPPAATPAEQRKQAVADREARARAELAELKKKLGKT